MSGYLFILIWLAVMALFQYFVETDCVTNDIGKKRVRKTWWFAVLVFIPLIWFAVSRSNKMGDTSSYIRTFNKMPSAFSELLPFYRSLGKDRLFYILEALIHLVISKDYKVFFFIIAAFQAFALIKLYRRYSSDYLIAIFLFVACGDYISWMNNGVRQFTAVSICLLATTWMIEKKYILSLITICIASRFHGSALLMIPIYLVCLGKPWNKRTLLVLIASLAAIVFVSQFTNWLDYVLEETQYENVVSDWKAWNDDGTNPIRVLVYSLPTILSLIGLRYIQEADDPVINFCTNMSVVTAGLYLVSMFTSGIFIGRLPIYASLYSNGILLPWEVKHIFNEKSAFNMRIAMICGYFLLYLYQLHFQWGII